MQETGDYQCIADDKKNAVICSFVQFGQKYMATHSALLYINSCNRESRVFTGTLVIFCDIDKWNHH
jgi:hypothetical protein